MDIQLSCNENFKLYRADVFDGTVASITIAVNYNVFEHGVAQFFTSRKAFTVNGCHLYGVEKAFSASIVTAVALCAHTADQLMSPQ